GVKVAAERLTDGGKVAVVLSAQHSNEDNFALASLAKAWKTPHVFVAGKPPVPDRADNILRVADVNPNAAGVKAIADAMGLALKPVAELDAALASGVKAVVLLGESLSGLSAGGGGESGRIREVDVIALAVHERGPVSHAKVALPLAAWAETAGTVTNAAGHVQRMHAAVPPPGEAIAGWEAIVRLAQARGVEASWGQGRDVFKDMVAQVPAWKGLTWAREARPLALRFAGSRG